MPNLSTYPITTVGGLVIAPDGDMLFLYSHKWNGCYTLPGGKVELGESRETAFIREIKEETGLDVTNVRFVNSQDSVYSPDFKEKRHFIMNDFIADLAPGCTKEDVILNHEAEAYVWTSLKDARQLTLNRESYKLLDLYEKTLPPKNIPGLIGFENLEIICIIGMNPEERIQLQPLFVDVKVEANFHACAQSDHVKDTIDYVTLGDICTELAQKGQYQLIEKYAYDVLQKLLQDFAINWAWIKIKKPQAMPAADFTTVELKLSKSEL